MSDKDQVPAPPEGFVPSSGRGPFSSHNGPLFHRVVEGEPVTEHAFYALTRHTNGVGLVHGGMLTAFMDGLLGAAVFRATRKTGVTIHLSVDFLHMARAGEWILGEAKVTRATRDVVFVEGRAHVGQRDVVRASGVFKLMHKGV
ncbi:PaaI family thioesterase [Phenylobacterium sp.]|uniref:PaaI family thioesterase n=1 Tax=Phenylobacterium sp. TaxID=1871053 RepID=UPI0035B2A6A8